MQRNERVEKRRVLIDGEEWPGLVAVRGLKRQEPTVDVPGFKKIVPTKSGIQQLQPFTLVYKIPNGSDVGKKLENWFLKNETHDITMVRTDAHGTEFDRKLYLGCEVFSYEEPDYDASSPVYAQATVEVTPFDIQTVE